jgi:ribonucleotide reductase alpha subunit
MENKRFYMIARLEVEGKDEAEVEKTVEEILKKTWERKPEEPKVISFDWLNPVPLHSKESEELDRIYKTLFYPKVRKKILEILGE